MCDLLDSYLDRQDETLALAKFLGHTFTLILAPSASKLPSAIYFRLWSMVMQILVDVHDPEACSIACSIVSGLSNKAGQEGSNEKEDALYMSKLGVQTIVQTLFKENAFETLKFLIDEFSVVSQCESSQAENDVRLHFFRLLPNIDFPTVA